MSELNYIVTKLIINTLGLLEKSKSMNVSYMESEHLIVAKNIN